MTTLKQCIRGGECGREVGFSLDHHAIRQQGARDRPDLVPGGEARLGTFVLLGQLPAIHGQPQPLGALLEHRDL